MTPPTEPTVLFICTGNFYRSRFAEAVFNHHAAPRGLPWRAFSRGLAIDLADGDLSPLTVRALAARAIPRERTGPYRVSLELDDLRAATVRIALHREEHYRMLQQRFQVWADRVEYWDVADIGYETPELALERIELNVKALLDRLAAEPTQEQKAG